MPSCKHCKSPATIKVNMTNFCGYGCAAKHGLKLKDKAKAAKEKRARQEHRKRKEAVRSNASNADLTQQSFNKMRRLEELLWFKERGVEPYCTSCQKPLGNDVWACGHYKTRGARSDLAFDRLNTFLQHNVSCNMHKSGDPEGMKIGLAMRFGEEEAQRIIDYCEVRQETPKRSYEDWASMRKEFNAEARRLQKLL